MTREEIEAMVPGRELDAHIALFIFQKEVKNAGPHYFIESFKHVLPPYSTNMSAAWEVVENFETIELKRFITDKNLWFCEIHRNGKWHRSFASTAPHAICRAALLAVLEATP